MKLASLAAVLCRSLLVGAATAASVLAQHTVLDESWTVTVNGQTVRVNPDGTVDVTVRATRRPSCFFLGPGS